MAGPFGYPPGVAPDLAGPVVSSNWFDRALVRQAGKADNNSVAPSTWPRPAAMTLFRRLDIGFHRRASANEVRLLLQEVVAGRLGGLQLQGQMHAFMAAIRTGLGLAIALDISRSHGGDITLGDSRAGGLRATVRVPV